MSPAPTKGPVSQRALVPELVALIDAAMVPNSTAHRDIARSKLRALLDVSFWRTSYVLNNISSRRARYIASLGYGVPSRWMLREGPRAKDFAEDEE